MYNSSACNGMAMNNSVKPVVANRTPSMYSKNGLWTNIVRRASPKLGVEGFTFELSVVDSKSAV